MTDEPGRTFEPVSPERKAEAARLVAETKEKLRRGRAAGVPRPPLSRHLEQAWSVPLGRTDDGRRQRPPADDAEASGPSRGAGHPDTGATGGDDR